MKMGRKITSTKPKLRADGHRIPVFINAYIADPTRNGTRAAIKAGYSKATAGQKAHELLKRSDIREMMAKAAYDMVKDLQFDGKMVLQELGTVAFSPILPGGHITSSAKVRALELLGQHFRLWEGSTGSKVINIHMTNIDLRTM